MEMWINHDLINTINIIISIKCTSKIFHVASDKNLTKEKLVGREVEEVPAAKTAKNDPVKSC
jgi:hypothetical protein